MFKISLPHAGVFASKCGDHTNVWWMRGRDGHAMFAPNNTTSFNNYQFFLTQLYSIIILYCSNIHMSTAKYKTGADSKLMNQPLF